MKKKELVFIPSPGIGHLLSIAELAKCLLERDDHLSVTILAIPAPGATVLELEPNIHIRCIKIPPVINNPSFNSSVSPEKFYTDFIGSHKPHVEHVIRTEFDLAQLAGIVIDMFCTSMIDIAHQLNIPSYLYFASGAASLGFVLNLPVHQLQVGTSNKFDVESIIPSYANRVPVTVVPSYALDKEGYTTFLYHGTRYSETNGYIVNTFDELEPYAVNSIVMTSRTPIYNVGPLLAKTGSTKWDVIKDWLDDQLASSVVFLCFGSRGCFDSRQLEQIANALESSEQRFLWSIRRPPHEWTFELPTEYEDFEQVLPDGFLERTKKKGMVCGWAPQVEILGHGAIGGFVSHCGWNSILESIWYGVPIATWPLYAEQQMNAFQLVRELGLGVELKMDYRFNSGEVVMAKEIERAMDSLMDSNNPVRKRVKEMSEKSRKAMVDGGSSYAALGKLIDDLHGNLKANR